MKWIVIGFLYVLCGVETVAALGLIYTGELEQALFAIGVAFVALASATMWRR